MSTKLEAARAARQDFDPLEFDRYTRFQELTRMMAESVNDVATVQRTLQRSLDSTEDELATHIAEGRLLRVLEDWCAPFDGFYIYYPSRQQMRPALRAFVDFFRFRI